MLRKTDHDRLRELQRTILRPINGRKGIGEYTQAAMDASQCAACLDPIQSIQLHDEAGRMHARAAHHHRLQMKNAKRSDLAYGHKTFVEFHVLSLRYHVEVLLDIVRRKGAASLPASPVSQTNAEYA